MARAFLCVPAKEITSRERSDAGHPVVIINPGCQRSSNELAKILTPLGEPTEPPVISPARGPPQGDFFDEAV